MSPKQSRWFLAGILITAGLVVTARSCRADDAPLDPVATLRQVNRILGTNVETPPTVVYVNRIVNRRGDTDWGAYAAGEVQISRKTLPGCEPLSLAHETGHHVAIKANLVAGIPNDAALLKAEMERISRKVELEFVPYSPNCFERTD